MKHIVLLGPAHPFRGGLAAFNERLARTLQQAGFKVTIITFTLQYPSFLFPGKSQFSDEPAPADLNISREVSSINPFSWIRTGRKLKKLKPDILMFRFWLPFMGPCFGSIARIVKRNQFTSIITLLDNVIPHEKRFGDHSLTSYFLKQSDAFIAMSKQVLNDLKQFNNTGNALLIPHPLYDYGASTDRNEACIKIKVDPAKKILLFFGFIRAYKGLDLLIKAMAEQELNDDSYHLVIAGEFYEDEKPYLELINQLNLNSKITLHTSYIPDDEVRYYFSAADLVVQPYRSATQSGISQMAFHFNKPMVVTAVGGLAEIVPDGVAGYVVKPEPSSIAKAIARFFNEHKSISFTQAVTEEKKKYSWDNFTRGIEELYARIKLPRS